MPPSETSPPPHPRPLPSFIERSMRAQSLLPTYKPLRDFFARALQEFQDSSSTFRVVCTRSGRSSSNDGASSAYRPPTPAGEIAARSDGKGAKRLVVLDSSFNPPTVAHMGMVVDALRSHRRSRDGATTRVLLLLSVRNADKETKPAGFAERMGMMWGFARDVQVALAEEDTEDEDESVAVDIDLGLTTQPYFHDKSAAIARSGFYAEQGQQQEDPGQVFLTGYDTLIRIFNPKYYTTGDASDSETTDGETTPMQAALGPFFDRAALRVAMRADDDWGGREEQVRYVEGLKEGDELSKVGGLKSWGERVELVEGRKGGDVVSSTLARKAAARKDWEALKGLVGAEVGRWVEREGLYEEDA